MAKAKIEHKSPIGAFLWSLPLLKDLRGIPEFKTFWRGMRIVALASVFGLLQVNFAGLVPAWLLPAVAPSIEKELRERVPSWFDF